MSVVKPCVIMQSVFVLNIFMLSIFIPSVIMLNAECLCGAKCLYTESPHVECLYSYCNCADCHYAECLRQIDSMMSVAKPSVIKLSVEVYVVSWRLF
jgi:hypothetical protein